jgi:HD-GYP domain-containing protein (c-di-GMP phosphodiesterase class II)
MPDAIATAQEQLARTLQRARAEEDRELATRVRELGAQLAHLLNGLFHMARTHALNNTAFDAPVREFGVALRQTMELLGPVSLQCVEDQIFVNDLRIRFDKLIEQSITLGSDLQRHAVGGLTFNGPLADPEIRTIVRLFSSPPATAGPRAALQSGLGAAGLSSVQVHPPFRFRITGEEFHQATREFREIYLASASTVAGVFANLGADRLPSPLPVRRLVHQLIDASRLVDAVAAALAAEQALPPFAQHTLMVTNLSIVIGRAAGLSDPSLADLGVAAMFHDVGFTMREDGYSVPFERHTRAGLRVLLRQRGFHRAKLRRLLTVLQHHEPFEDGSGAPGLYARIVHIADDYDTLTRYRPNQGPILSTPDGLARIAAQAGKAYDPLLMQLFCNVMGRFPPGAILSLADGHVVLSISTVRSPETFDKPLCKVIRRPDATSPAEDELLDLAKGGTVLKVHHPRG